LIHSIHGLSTIVQQTVKIARTKLKPSDYGHAALFLLALCSMAAIHKVRKSIGTNIRRFRKKACFSQERLAEKADLHPVYISQVERGEKAVSVEALWRLSKALDVPMAFLFRGV